MFGVGGRGPPRCHGHEALNLDANGTSSRTRPLAPSVRGGALSQVPEMAKPTVVKEVSAYRA